MHSCKTGQEISVDKKKNVEFTRGGWTTPVTGRGKGLAQLAVSCSRGSMCLIWCWILSVYWKWKLCGVDPASGYR